MPGEGLSKPLLQCPLEQHILGVWAAYATQIFRISKIKDLLFGGIHMQMTNDRISNIYSGLASETLHRVLYLDGPKLGLVPCRGPPEILHYISTRGPAFTFCTGC